MLTLIRNFKNWRQYCGLLDEKVKAIDDTPAHFPSLPLNYPVLVDSFVLARGAKYEIKHVIFTKYDARKLLDIK